MTDKLPPLSTQIVAPSQTALPAPAATPTQGATKQEAVEEEPYTIKCICSFSDDDGNTIYCDTCDTWQHIECFYPDTVEDALREDFAHSCAECKPRPLDRQKAYHRQSARITMPARKEEAADKKPKRPPTKSHKKKPKPTDLQLNGQSSSNSSHEHPKNPTSQEHPPAKKSKNSHKASHSISSQAPKRSPPLTANGRVNHGHPPSPATTPPDIPNSKIHFSQAFRSLYDEQVSQIVQTNSFVRLEISNTMSVWLRDPDRMRRETGLEFPDVYQDLPKNINSLKRNPQIEHKRVQLTSDTALDWQYLVAPSAIEKDVPLMELNGQIGFQKDYCADPENRWEELTSPLPFVFFHPMLPLYIDTRKEGSRARYVRRSCKPNAVLETFLSEGSEYHFWLVSDRPIAAKEQITISWDFRFPIKNKPRMLRLLGLGDEEAAGTPVEPEIDELEYQSIASWVNLVLSEYGGCACDLGRNCAFDRFHRNYSSGTQTPANAPKKKSRKPKTQHTLSPTSTGHATNSRAASEGHLEDAPDLDGTSQSGSTRSKPPSRDMTPARQGSFDTLGILTEPTDRDKRKVAMVEDSFRRMEQQLPPRKKKRVSDGTGTNKTKSTSRGSSSQAPNLPNGTAERRYVDSGTSRSKSNSPFSMASPRFPNHHKPASSRHGSAPANSRLPSVSPRPNYSDAAVQTDAIEGEWYSGTSCAPKSRRRLVSLSKRLLNNRHRSRLDGDEQQEQTAAHAIVQDGTATAMDIDSPTVAQKPSFESPAHARDSARATDATSPSLAGSNDIPMADAVLASPTEMKPPTAVVPTAAAAAASSAKQRSPDLRVQMPGGPAFGSPVSAISTASTPLSAGSAIVQSPFSASSNLASPFGPPAVNGIAVNPSPVKKKLSLSDYRSRMNKVQAARPSIGTTMLKPPSANGDEPKSATSVDTPGAADSPTEKTTTDAGVSTNGISTSASTGANV